MILVVLFFVYYLLVYRRLARLSIGFQDRQTFLSTLSPALMKLGFVSNSAPGETLTFRAKSFMQGSDITVTIVNQTSAAVVGPRPSVNALKKFFPGAAMEPNVGNQPWSKVLPPMCATAAIYLVVITVVQLVVEMVVARA